MVNKGALRTQTPLYTHWHDFMGIYKFTPGIISLLPRLALRNHSCIAGKYHSAQPGPEEPVFPVLARGVAS